MNNEETTHKMSELLYRIHVCLAIIENGADNYKYVAKQANIALSEFLELELEQIKAETERTRLMVESNIMSGA